MKNAIIIGAGPAGASAAIYLLRAGFKVTVIYKDQGALGLTAKLENYYGFANPMTGPELFEAGLEQIKRLGADIVQDEVLGIQYGEKLTLSTKTKNYPGDVIIIATGASRMVPRIKGLNDYEGKGVSYCAVCDAFFYKDRDVAVLGSSNYAVHEAKELLPTARSVTLFTQGKELTADEVPEELKIDTRKILNLVGSDALEGLQLEDESLFPCEGLFIAYGVAGSVDLAKKVGADVDGRKIIVDESFATNVEGLYACGDCTGGLLQIATAVYEGAKAATTAIKYLRKR